MTMIFRDTALTKEIMYNYPQNKIVRLKTRITAIARTRRVSPVSC